MKIIKKILAVIIVLIEIIMLGNSVKAASNGELKELERAEKGYYCVQKWDGSKWIYLTYNRTYYTDTDGEKYVAYCLSPGLPGVGYVSGEKETYQVKIKQVLNDDRVWRIMKNGYPYKTIQELGVETADDAYFATMQAINCVLRGYSLEQAKELYSPGQFAINGENLEDIKRRGTKTLNAMYNLINLGLNGSETRSKLMNISIKKCSEFEKENENFYSQTFQVQSTSEISQYYINKLENLPKGTYVSDINGNKKQNFKNGEKFKIMIPKNNIINDINGKVTIIAEQKNYPIYHGTSQIEGYQDYALCNNPYSEVYTTSEVYVQTNKSKVIITKVDKDTQKPISGVKFKIQGSDGITNTYSTNENGKIELSNQKPGKVTIKEIGTIGKYTLNDKEIKVELGFGEVKNVTIENELKKGNIKIIKTDSEDNTIKLSGVKFQLKNESEEVIKEGTTDKNGELVFEDLVIGKYKVEEIETNENYELNEKEIEIEVEYGKTKEIEVINELKKGNIKIIKTDSEDNSIKLSGVKFQLKNESEEVIEEGTTDKNGELVFEDLVIGKYKVMEIETNENYKLNEKEIEIEVEYGKTKEIEVINELKKGNIKIIKTDSEDNSIKLSGVKFQLKNESEEVIEEGTTDKNGELVFEDLVIGKYKVMEIETNENYELNEKEIEIEVEFNETKEIEVTNELKKGSIKIIKVDEEDKNIKLENVVFRLLDKENNILKEGKTNEKGELIFENITVGKYKIVEVETNSEYELLKEEIEIEVKSNIVNEIVIKNEKKQIVNNEQIEKLEKEEETEIENTTIELPKTGNNRDIKYQLLLGTISINVYIAYILMKKYINKKIIKVRHKKQ